MQDPGQGKARAAQTARAWVVGMSTPRAASRPEVVPVRVWMAEGGMEGEWRGSEG